MQRPHEASPLIGLVLDQVKPGALVVIPSDDERKFREDYTQYDLEIEKVRSRGGLVGLAVARRQLAGVVLEESDVKNELNYLVDLSPGMLSVATLSVARALVHLETNRETVKGRERQPAGVASLEGSLLGYKNCDIKYYVSTRYFQEDTDEVSEGLIEAIPPETWPDPHILCGKCALSKLIELGKDV